MNKTIVNDIGWAGVIMILVAYALSALKVLSPTGLIYLLANIIGSLFIVLEASKKKDTQMVALNAIWALIAVIALAKVWF